jgi:L-alanine-DL-glutamate epimerase-like enolase superfamily enzyme
MTTIKVKEVDISFEDFAYRTPMKFRATVVDRVTLLNVRVRVESKGRTGATGFGSMTLGNVWSYPSATLTYRQTLDAMKDLAYKFSAITQSLEAEADPIELNQLLESRFFDAAPGIPQLCTLVVASAFDAAIHDAFGKTIGASCYRLYGPDFIQHDLSRYLDHQFKGEYIDRYVSPEPRPSLHVYHLVGALDPLSEADLKTPVADGWPETLQDWVRADGIDHIKIKLDGGDLDWDVDRVLSVDRVLDEIHPNNVWRYSLDFNERCENAAYVLECFARLQEAAPLAFHRVQYIEQPTKRDLNAPDTPDMHAAAKIKPVVIDESLTDYQSLLRARELGYSGVALKACKGQSNALLMAAAAQKFKMFTCMQDLTCPGASLLQSVSLAAHIPPIHAVESNARQYLPAANLSWESRFPGIFHVQEGKFQTASLYGPGLGIIN